jgi:hypothetical protein
LRAEVGSKDDDGAVTTRLTVSALSRKPAAEVIR